MGVETLACTRLWRFGTALLLIGSVWGAVLVPARALSDPITDIALPLSSTASPVSLAPGSDGAMWLTVVDSTSPYAYRVMEVGEEGSVLVNVAGPQAANKSQSGSLGRVLAAPDGGAWAAATPDGAGLAHISSTGVVLPVTLPQGYFTVGTATPGRDGRLWLIGQKDEMHPAGGGTDTLEETYAVIAVTTAGEVSVYPLPAFARTFTVGPGKVTLDPQVALVPVEHGMWVGSTAQSEPADAAFVSYGGTVTSVSVPTGAYLVASAGGDAAWWESPFWGSASPETTPTINVGTVTASGQVNVVREFNQSVPGQTLVNTGEGGGHYVSAAFGAGTRFVEGPEGTLLWSESTPYASEQQGAVGTIAKSGETRFTVGKWGTYVPPPTPYGSGTGTAACSFGGQLYQATGGDIWIISGGHPTILSVLTPLDEFSTFLPITPYHGEELRTAAMALSSTGRLWFTVTKAVGTGGGTSAYLAWANPNSPPPGFPPFPGGGIGQTPPGVGNPGGQQRRRVVRVRITGVRRRHLRLEVEVGETVRDAIRTVTITLPSGLSVGLGALKIRREFDVTDGSGHRLSWHVSGRGRTLIFRLGRAVSRVEIKTSVGAIRATKALTRDIGPSGRLLTVELGINKQALTAVYARAN